MINGQMFHQSIILQWFWPRKSCKFFLLFKFLPKIRFSNVFFNKYEHFKKHFVWKVEQFRGVAITNCSSKFKGGVTSKKKIESKFPANMHIYALSPLKLQSLRKFCWAVSEEFHWQTVSVVYLYFGQISKFNRGITPRKKSESFCTSS